MPNGGSDNCACCTHFKHAEPFDREDSEDWRCALRDAQLKGSPYWTTCDNWTTRDNVGEKATELSGPMRAIVGYVKDGAVSYVRLPYLNGYRPEAYQPDGRDTIIRIETENGRDKEFDRPRAYLDFYAVEKK